MFEKLQQLWQNPKALLKIVGAVIIVLIVLSLLSSLFGNTLRNLGLGEGFNIATSPSMGGRNVAYDGDMAEEMGAVKMDSANQAMPSPMPPQDGGFSGGDDAEDFEITEYNASIRTTDKEPVCAEIANL